MATQPPTDPNVALRRSIYGILICIGLGAMIGRILAVDSIDYRRLADVKFQKRLEAKRKEFQDQGLSGIELDYALSTRGNGTGPAERRVAALPQRQRPQPLVYRAGAGRAGHVRGTDFSPPPRIEFPSPWHPYAIDKVVNAHVVNGKLKMRPGWDTIDMVQHNGHYYSSKPPLLSTLMAAEYWVIYHATGKSLGTHPYEIGRFMLITINGACLLLLFLFTARLVERLGTTDWGRILVMASCVFGTFLTTFAITITNHLPAAACTAVLLDALVRIWLDGDRRAWTFIVAGFFSAMLAANEVPAAAAFGGGKPDHFLPGAAEDVDRLPARRPCW